MLSTCMRWAVIIKYFAKGPKRRTKMKIYWKKTCSLMEEYFLAAWCAPLVPFQQTVIKLQLTSILQSGKRILLTTAFMISTLCQCSTSLSLSTRMEGKVCSQKSLDIIESFQPVPHTLFTGFLHIIMHTVRTQTQLQYRYGALLFKSLRSTYRLDKYYYQPC